MDFPATPLPPRETAADACARAVREAILRGELAAGERLPPERELALRFGVNRVTVRSALARLAAEHLLSARQGSGHLVLDYRREGGPGLLPAIAAVAGRDGEVAEVARELLRVRRHLARGVLEAVAENARAPELDAVQQAIDRFEALAERERDPIRIAAADLDVLGALLEATRSPVLRLSLNPVLAVLSDLPVLRDALYARPRENAAGWRALATWLRRPTPAGIDRIDRILAERDTATLARIRRRSA